MSYLHCPSCQRAFNLAVHATCPYCPVHAAIVDPAEDIVAAAEQLARAMARATAAERGIAATRMEHLALPAPGDESARHRAPVMRQIRDVIGGAAARVAAPAPPTLRATVALMIERGLASLEVLWPRRSSTMIGDGLRRVRARVKAIAQA